VLVAVRPHIARVF